MLPPYAPPIYRSVDNFQDCGATSYIVPPPVFDPTDLPPPYTSRNASLSSSGFSLYEQSQEHRRSQLERDSSRGREGRASLVIQEVTTRSSANQFQQRIYSENRGRPGNPGRITSAILTRNGVLEFQSNGNTNHGNRTADQSLNSSQASLQSEARRPLDIIGQRIEGIAQCIETRVFQRYEKAKECKEQDESEKLNAIQGQNITNAQQDKWKYSYKQSTNRTQRCLSSVDQSAEIITFEDRHDCSKANNNNDVIPNGKIGRDIAGEWNTSSSIQIEEESSSNSDSGLGEDLSPLCQSINSNKDYNASVNITCSDAGNGELVDTETCNNQEDRMSHDEISTLNGFAGKPGFSGEDTTCNSNTKDLTGDQDQGNSEASCKYKEYGTSANLLESQADNVFGVRWNLFGISSGTETLTSISGNDGKKFQPNPVVPKLFQTAGSAEENTSHQYHEHQRSESQGQLIRKTMPGYSISDDATYNKMMQKETYPNSWSSNEDHLHLMSSDGNHSQLSSDAGHKLMPSDSSHCKLMMIDTGQCQLIPSDATHCQLSSDANQELIPSDANQELTPSDSCHPKLMMIDTSQHQLMPSDATHSVLSSDASQELTPSDSSHRKLMISGTSQHQLMPDKIEAGGKLGGQGIRSDGGCHKLTPNNASNQSYLSAKQQCKLETSDEKQQLIPTNVNVYHQMLIPLDAGHQVRQEMILQHGATHHQLIPGDIDHLPLIPVDAASQHCLQPDHETLAEESNTYQDANFTASFLSTDGKSGLDYPHWVLPALVSEAHASGKLSPENAASIPYMDCDVLDSQRSADCCEDGYSESVLELKNFRQKDSDNIEFMMEESGGGLFNKKEKTDKETFTGNQNIMSAGLGKPEKSNSETKMEDVGIPASGNRHADGADEVIRLMDHFHSSNINKVEGDGPPVVQMDANIEGLQMMGLCLSQQAASRMHDTAPSKDSNQLESNMSRGRSSVEYNSDHAPGEAHPGDTLAANFTETLSDSGSEHEETLSVRNKPLTWSDTCIAQETNYLVPKEKTRTCSDPEVKVLRATGGVEFMYHRKNIRNHGRLLYDESFGVVPPNIELPLEMRNQGLGYCCPEESKIRNRNTGHVEQGRKQRSTGSVNNLVKHKPKNQSCYHGNREALLKNKDDLLKKEQALMKTIKLRNEMSRSLVHLYREKKLNPRSKDSASVLRPGLEISPNALKKRQLVQKVHSGMGNCKLVSSMECPTKTGHHKHCAKDVTGTGSDSSGKETFV